MNPARASVALRVALAIAYPFLAHAASGNESPALAALALFDVLLLVLAGALLQPRPAAWLLLAFGGAFLWGARHSPLMLVALLLVPVTFMALVAWAFLRSLRSPRGALVTRLVAALEGVDQATLARESPDVYRYSRRLAALWGGVLALLAGVNLVLALVAQPRGVLPVLGIAAPFSVTETQWSWIANWLNYGLIGAMFVGEFLYRQRRFPGRYAGVGDFIGRLRKLDAGFWRGFLR